MATTFDNRTIYEGNNIIIVHLQGYGDTDQTGVSVLDLSTLTFPDNRQAGHTGVDGSDTLSLLEVRWSVQGWEYVQLLWDHTTDDEIITMSGDGQADFRGVGGLHDPGSSGGTGDVLLTSQGADTDSSYDITAVFKKKQG